MAGDRDDLTRLVGEIRATDAARGRSRERWLRQQATEDATLAGVLTDLADEGADVTVRLRSGRPANGRIVRLGKDFFVLQSDPGASVVVIAQRAVTAIRRRPGDRGPDTTGDRARSQATSLAAYLAAIAPERPRVAASVTGEPGVLVGELRSAGRDVLTLVVDGEPPVTVYLALVSLESLSVSAPG
jgi:hypothetical protein